MSDFTTNKILAAFTLALALMGGLMLARWGLGSPVAFLTAVVVVEALTWVGIAGTVGGIVWHIVDVRRGADLSRRIITGRNAAIAFALVALSCLSMLYLNYSTSIKALFVIVPGLAILYLIFCMFQREFFYISLYSAVAAFYFWQLSRLYRGTELFTASQVLFIVFTLLFTGLIFLAKQNSGVLKIGKLKLKILGNTSGCALVYAAAIVGIAFVILAFFVSTGWIIYLAYMMLAYVFLAAVFYTVKLM